MSKEPNDDWGCVMVLIIGLIFFVLYFGLQTPWGRFGIDWNQTQTESKP